MHLKLTNDEARDAIAAANTAKAAADAAAKACTRAGVNASEALELSGYAEESVEFITRRDKKGEVQLSRSHCLAVMQGLRLTIEQLTKIEEKLTDDFFVHAEEVDVRSLALNKLHRRLRADISDQFEAPLEESAAESPGEEAQPTAT